MLDGQVSRIFAVPLTVMLSFWVTSLWETWTSPQPSASMRTNPSWAVSPCADTVWVRTPVNAAAPRRATSAMRIHRLIAALPRSVLLEVSEDGPDGQSPPDELPHPVSEDTEGGAEGK